LFGSNVCERTKGLPAVPPVPGIALSRSYIALPWQPLPLSAALTGLGLAAAACGERQAMQPAAFFFACADCRCSWYSG